MPRTTTASPRRSSRAQAKKENVVNDKHEEEEEQPTTPLKDSNANSKPKASSKKAASGGVKGKAAASKKKAPAAAAKKRKTAAATAESDSEPESPKKKATKKKKAEPQRLTERDEIPQLWNPAKDDNGSSTSSYTFKIASWNVAGLRGLLKKDPQALATLVQKHDLDVLTLQETKLQEMHLDDPKLKLKGHLLEAEGYDAYYSCSTTKKGYSGTACFVKRRGGGNGGKAQQKNIQQFFGKKDDKKKKQESTSCPIDETLLVPETVTYSLGKGKHDGEGRVICLDFPLFTLVALYVPNSGQKLERLDYRTQEWDQDLLEFVQEKQATRNVPVMWMGDLNVAHTNLEVWNDGAKHLDKQAGVTPQERASFQAQLDAGFIDVFRKLHPTAKGHYSYWSQRAGNREPNKGLRLDYFIADPALFDEDKSKVIVRDSYMLFDQMGSDHCPAVVALEIKP